MDDKNNGYISMTKGIISILFYVFMMNFGIMGNVLKLLGRSVDKLGNFELSLYQTLFSIIILVFLIFINLKEIKKAIDDFKVNHKKYFKKYFKFYLIGLAVMMISNLVLNALSGGIAANQNTIIEMTKSMPIYIIFASVIFAPIVEELVFRLSFKRVFKNKYIFILLSGLVFGFMHILSGYDGSAFTLIDLLYIIPYSSLGFVFAYMMEVSDNFLVSTSIHFMHNGILMALQIFLLVFS